jgi:O-antigen ligase
MGDKLVSSWHNDYIQLYLDSGIFALASFFWIIILTYKKGIQTFRKISDKLERSYLLALIASISVFIFLGGSFDYLCGILFKCLISTFVLYNIYISNKLKEVSS